MKHYFVLLAFLLQSLILLAQKRDTTNTDVNNPSSGYYNQKNTPSASSMNQMQMEEDKKIVQLGAALNFAKGIATNENISSGVGFSFKLGYNWLNKVPIPISLLTGLGFDYLYFGGESSSLQNGASLKVNSNAYGWYPYAEIDLFPDFMFSPFGGVYSGLRFYKTRQNINYFDINNEKQTKSDNIDGDITKINGWSAGLKIRMVEHIKVEIRYQRNFGNVAKVIDPKSITFNPITGNLASYKNSETDTDFEMIFLGVLFSF